jgi:Protein of unknown function (DUF2281)
MTIRENATNKLNQLPETLVQEVSDFIDFVAYKHQSKIIESQPDATLVETWSKWFKAVDDLDVTLSEPDSTYSELLLKKYR